MGSLVIREKYKQYYERKGHLSRERKLVLKLLEVKNDKISPRMEKKVKQPTIPSLFFFLLSKSTVLSKSKCTDACEKGDTQWPHIELQWT